MPRVKKWNDISAKSPSFSLSLEESLDDELDSLEELVDSLDDELDSLDSLDSLDDELDSLDSLDDELDSLGDELGSLEEETFGKKPSRSQLVRAIEDKRGEKRKRAFLRKCPRFLFLLPFSIVRYRS